MNGIRKGLERLSGAGGKAAGPVKLPAAAVEAAAEVVDGKTENSEEITLTDHSPKNEDAAAEVAKAAEVEATLETAVDVQALAASTPEPVPEALPKPAADEPPSEAPAQRGYETSDATAPDEIEEEEAIVALTEASSAGELADQEMIEALAFETVGVAEPEIEPNQRVAGTETAAEIGKRASEPEGQSQVTEAEAGAEMSDAAAAETGPMQVSRQGTLAPETVLSASAGAEAVEPEAPAAPPPHTPGVTQQSTPAMAERSREQKTADRVTAALKARGQDADQSPFSVNVARVYDGPLDLLLDLIRKQDIDIYDIPIARITAQFLAYVDQLKSTDVDVAGDFIYTASLLIHIKSRMLLPRMAAGPEEAAEDPRRELVERLLEHERFKNAAQMLQQKHMLEAATWTNPGMREFREDAAAEPEIAADTVDLVRVFRDILERVRNRPVLNLEEDSVTVGQMIQFLSRRLTMEDKPVSLRKLLSHTRSERALIAMFLALLELVRLQAILLRQDLHFSEIFIKKHTGFEAVMNQGLANARDDWR